MLFWAVLPQNLPSEDSRTAYEVVAGAFPETGQLLAEFHQLSQQADEASLDRLMKVQERLEALDGWRLDQKVTTILGQYGVDPDQTLEYPVRRLAAPGSCWPRRWLPIRTYCCWMSPQTIWMYPLLPGWRRLLGKFRGAMLFVSHDRAFIRRMATRIVELDSGQARELCRHL